MHSNLVYFMLGLGLSFFSNVWARSLLNNRNVNTVYIKLDLELAPHVIPLFEAGLPYIFKNMPTMDFPEHSRVRIVAGTEPSLGRGIFFKIYADSQMQTLKGRGTVRYYDEINLCSLRVFDNTLQKGVLIGPHPDDKAQFKDRNRAIVVEEKLHEQMNGLSLHHGP